MVGAEDSPAHQHPTLSFASALGDVLYKGLSTTKHPLLRIFVAFFAQMCPFAVFQTKMHVAVSIAGAQVKLWQIVM